MNVAGWEDVGLEPGPWYALSTREKVSRWLRYQPAYTLRHLGWWVGSTVGWYARWRWLPKRDPSSTWCNRIVEDGDALCPRCMWRISVAQDAPQLERWHRLVFPS